MYILFLHYMHGHVSMYVYSMHTYIFTLIHNNNNG